MCKSPFPKVLLSTYYIQTQRDYLTSSTHACVGVARTVESRYSTWWSGMVHVVWGLVSDQRDPVGLGGGWMGGGGCGEEEEERRGFRRETWDHHFQPHFTLQLHRNRQCQQYLLPPKSLGMRLCICTWVCLLHPHHHNAIDQFLKRLYVIIHVVTHLCIHLYRISNAHPSKCFCIACVYAMYWTGWGSRLTALTTCVCMRTRKWSIDKQHMQGSRAGKSCFTFKKESTIEFWISQHQTENAR